MYRGYPELSNGFNRHDELLLLIFRLRASPVIVTWENKNPPHLTNFDQGGDHLAKTYPYLSVKVKNKKEGGYCFLVFRIL